MTCTTHFHFSSLFPLFYAASTISSCEEAHAGKP